MRHCFNENVSVYEDKDSNLARLLRRAAVKVDELGEGLTFNVHTTVEFETGEYILTLYAHE